MGAWSRNEGLKVLIGLAIIIWCMRQVFGLAVDMIFYSIKSQHMGG